ncbi:MAG TPA: Fic family protein [Geothrix sp.]
MPSPKGPRDLETAILAVLAGHAEGLAREALQKAVGLGKEEPWRFRRRLEALERQQRIRKVGVTRGMLYLMGTPAPAAPTDVRVTVWEHSSEGTQALALLGLPRGQRQPCTYERSFLDAYRPNETFYLGEAHRARLHVLGRTPEAEAPAGTYARQMLERLLIDLSWNSSRLEGNTYSLLDTERLFKAGGVPEGKSAQETQMILNHKQAIEYLVEGAVELTLSPGAVRALHGMLSDNLLPDPADEGRLRQSPVSIGDSMYVPLAAPQLIEEIFEQMLLTAQAIQDPFEQSFFILVHLPYLQPFADANKRTSRLAANLPLLKRNLQPLSFSDVPRDAYLSSTLAVYENRRMEALRDVYLWAYQQSSERYQVIRRSMGEPDPFRLRYRAQLREAVHQVVHASKSVPEIRKHIASYLEAVVPTEDRIRFQAALSQELRNLNEGTYARYGLRPSEFEGWKPLQLEWIAEG